MVGSRDARQAHRAAIGDGGSHRQGANDEAPAAEEPRNFSGEILDRRAVVGYPRAMLRKARGPSSRAPTTLANTRACAIASRPWRPIARPTTCTRSTWSCSPALISPFDGWAPPWRIRICARRGHKRATGARLYQTACTPFFGTYPRIGEYFGNMGLESHRSNPEFMEKGESMRKKGTKSKLRIRRETLRELNPIKLRHVAGEAPRSDVSNNCCNPTETTSDNCTPITCPPDQKG